MSTEPITDTPYQRTDLTQLTEDQLVHLVASIQARRLKARKAYEEAQVLKLQALTEKTRTEIAHVLSLIQKDLNALDKVHDRITKRMAKIEGLKNVIRVEQIEAEHEGPNGT